MFFNCGALTINIYMPIMLQSLKQIPSSITGMGGLKSSLACK
jgi:hypothetical protein